MNLFKLSDTEDGTHGGGSEYTHRVTLDETAKTLTLDVDETTPSQLYYYCSQHGSHGNDLPILDEPVPEPIEGGIDFVMKINFQYIHASTGNWTNLYREQPVTGATMGTIVEHIYVMTGANATLDIRNLSVTDDNGVVKELPQQPYPATQQDGSAWPSPGLASNNLERIQQNPPGEASGKYLYAQVKVPYFEKLQDGQGGWKYVFAPEVTCGPENYLEASWPNPGAPNRVTAEGFPIDFNKFGTFKFNADDFTGTGLDNIFEVYVGTDKCVQMTSVKQPKSDAKVYWDDTITGICYSGSFGPKVGMAYRAYLTAM